MSGFGADTGAAEPAVRTALRAATANDGDPAATEAAEATLVRALLGGRFLLPVLAAPPAVAQAWASEGHSHDPDDEHGRRHARDGHGHGHDEAMAAVRLVAPDGRQGLPVFTGLDALTEWDATARPLPMTAADTARMGIEEGCDVLIVDLGQPHGYVLRTSLVWALAEERAWLPARHDPLVIAAVEAGARGLEGVARATVGDPGADDEPGTFVVDLLLEPGLDAGRVQAVSAAMAERLAADPMVRCRLDAVRFAVRPA